MMSMLLRRDFRCLIIQVDSMPIDLHDLSSPLSLLHCSQVNSHLPCINPPVVLVVIGLKVCSR
jgi:hypothetical protein